jgi:hypothetical protein
VYRDDSELSTEQLEQGGVGENSNGKFGGEEDEDEVYIEHQADDFGMQACMSNICAAPAYAGGSFSSRKGDAKPVESGQSKPTNLENFAIRCIFGDSNPAPQQQPRESCIRSEAAALGSVERKQVRGERNSNDSALREEDLQRTFFRSLYHPTKRSARLSQKIEENPFRRLQLRRWQCVMRRSMVVRCGYAR